MSFVMVWENNMLKGGRAKNTIKSDGSTATWPGHASLNIGDKFNPASGTIGDQWTNYVSFVPGGTEAETKRVGGFAASSKGGLNENFFADLWYETYWPDHIIHIPDTNIDLLKAEAKWKEIYTTGVKYKMATYNCSDVVVQVLKAGGFTGASTWASYSLIWTPNKVRKFALSGGGTLLTTVAEFMPYLGTAGVPDAATLFACCTDPTSGEKIMRTRDGQFCTFRTPLKPAYNPDATYRNQTTVDLP